MPIVIHGVSPSPFVRKVRVFLVEKGIDYQLVPVPPFPPANATAEFRRMSPLGKIPALQEGGFTVPDSSVICAYLEKVHPEPALYPADPQEYARALWFEEYADSKMAESIGPIFFERTVKTKILKQEPDPQSVRKAIAENVPEVCAYLEDEIGDAEFMVGGRFSIADIAIATQLQQLHHGGESLDASRWPRLAAYAERIHGRPSFKGCIEEEVQLFASM
jgi:glutathione S-transferase